MNINNAQKSAIVLLSPIEFALCTYKILKILGYFKNINAINEVFLQHYKYFVVF